MARPTGDAYVDSILYGDNKWGIDTLRYVFVDTGDAWTSAAKAAFRSALETWSDVADIDFRETYFVTNANLWEYYYDDEAMSLVSSESGVLGQHQVPNSTNFTRILEGWFNWETFGWPESYGYDADSLEPGGQAMSTFIHEIGHALGLAHPHDADGVTVRMPGVSHYSDLGDHEFNQGLYTVMSYNDGWADQNPWDNAVNDRGYNSGPGAFDIAAIQYLYGADTSNESGNTTYRLNSSMGWSAIWDTGGNDTMRYSGSRDAVLNLNAAPLDEGSHAGGYLSYLKGSGNYGGYTIAGDFTNALGNKNGETGVIIENATGGSGDDKITGNRVDNVLKGNSGADWLSSRAGDDRVDGGSGNDKITAGSGDDFVLGGRGGDELRGDSGSDMLGGGSGSDKLIGGTGGDVLKGSTGKDVLRGGGGIDKFVFRDGDGKDTIQDFKSGTDRLALDEDLWGGGMTAQEVVDAFGRDKGSYTVLNFGTGDILTFDDVANPDALVGGISFI